MVLLPPHGSKAWTATTLSLPVSRKRERGRRYTHG